MGSDTAIEWADDTANPWWGCAKVSPACANCYAETRDARFKMGGEPHWGPAAPRYLRAAKAVGELDRIARRSDSEGRPRRVFIASMSDFFEDRDDLVEPRKVVWDALHRLGRRITPMLLTKRPEVMAAWAAEHGWPEGAWAGTTVEDQRRADERVPHLLRVPAPVRFLSMEPLLEAVSLLRVPFRQGERVSAHSGNAIYVGDDGGAEYAWSRRQMLDWVIVGGESGPGARPMHPDWARSLRDQCQSAGVAFFLKQASWSGILEKMPHIDGRQWMEIPDAAQGS